MKELLMLGGIMSYEYKGRRWNTMQVDSEDTIYSVMLRVEEITGVRPVFQRFTSHCSRDCKSFYYDTPGTLAENKLVPTYPGTISVDFIHSGFDVLQRDTLRNMGLFRVDDGKFPDPSVLDRAVAAQKKVMLITVMDHIRMDGGGREMVVVAEAGDTVATVMEEVQRRRRYPVAMQELCVGDAGTPSYKHTPMDRLDATLADYNLTWDTSRMINLYLYMVVKKRLYLHMNRAFALRADREARGLDKPKEIVVAAPAEQQKLADEEEK